MGKNIHVTKRKTGQWAVIGEGDKKASSLHDTQKEAKLIGRDLARKNESELIIHDKKNRILDKDSFGNDPYPPKDKKH